MPPVLERDFKERCKILHAIILDYDLKVEGDVGSVSGGCQIHFRIKESGAGENYRPLTFTFFAIMNLVG
jgi:hypothetical protein